MVQSPQVQGREGTAVAAVVLSPLRSSSKGALSLTMPAPAAPALIDSHLTALDDDEAELLEQQPSPHAQQRLRRLLSPRVSLLESLPPLCGPLGTLCQGLKSSFARERAFLPPGAVLDADMPQDSFVRLDGAVRQLMQQYVGSFAAGEKFDWEKEFFTTLHQAYNRFHYVRHLIDATDDYELMVICWGPGQVSRVHNHAHSHCWLTCLLGEVQEKQYVPEDQLLLQQGCGANGGPPRGATPPPPGVMSCMEPCPNLHLTNTLAVKAGQTGYVNDKLCLHSVGCPTTVPEPGAVTLHLYAPPIRRVQLYEPEEGRVMTRVPGFFTLRGRPT